MIKITLKDGSVKEFENKISVLDLAKSISEGLARVACAGIVNGEVVDLRYEIEKDSEVSIATFDNEEGQHAFRHTAAHMLAQAVKRLYPTAKLAIGPSIDNGFYYDVDFVDGAITVEDLPKIEEEMKKIAKENLEITRFELSRSEALKLMAEQNEEYKVELITDLPEDEILSFYKMREFVDLCAGPHLMTTKPVKAFKLYQLAGAYWRGDEKNKMLTRIYGTAFTKASDLEAYLVAREEAKKRDHNKLGRELKIFTTSDIVGQGLPLLMPKGAKIVQLLQRWIEDTEESRGYVFTKTPFMAKSDLFKVSGHWDHYKDGMFIIGDKEDEDNLLALRPMTCPFQYIIYNAEQHSYRDLPIRYSETSTLCRNESSGEMHGLIRVRQFTLADGHIVCRPDQVSQEFKDTVDLIKYIMTTLGIQDSVTYRFSKWDPKNKAKYIDNPEAWESTQNEMRVILNELGLKYKEAEGEAAFYGPKLDIQFKNVHGKEDTIITVQLDFALADRFDMSYVDADGNKKRPFIIHRSSIGCYERTLAMIIERFAGAFPLWLCPTQVKVLPISEKYHDYTEKVVAELKKRGIRVEGDFRGEKIGYKIREARNERIPYLLIVGEKEAEENTVSVRRRGEELGAIALQDLINRIVLEVAEKTID